MPVWTAQPQPVEPADVGNNHSMTHKQVLMVVLFVLVPLRPLTLVDCQIRPRVYQALVVLARFSRDGMFVMSGSLGDQESEFLHPPQLVGLRDLFLRRYLILRPKFLHVALVELEGATFDSLRIVRCRSLEIFRALGWPGRIFPYLYEYQ